MRVVIATEARFYRGADGVVRSRTPAEAYQHWRGYLGVFDEVVVLARVGPPTAPPVRLSFPVEGRQVRVVALPPYQGPAGYLRNVRRLRSVIAAGLERGGVLAPSGDTRYLAVMPGMIGAALITELRRRGLDYAVEIIGDAEAVAGGMFGGWARRPARRWLARQAAGAAAVSYVTRQMLQRRYPPAPGALTASYGYGRLSRADFAAAPRARASRPPSPATVATIGSQDRMYKGHDILLEAVGLLDFWGYRLRVVIVGSGRHHEALVRAARREGLDEVVEFVPALDRRGIHAVLDAADLFVLPSRTEGLPRALIEAMARGVPCLATAVGGTVELLAPQDLVPAGDPVALAVRMSEVLTSPTTLAAMSERNLAAAEEYRGDRLAARAQAFYAALVGAPDRTRPTAGAPRVAQPTRS